MRPVGTHSLVRSRLHQQDSVLPGPRVRGVEVHVRGHHVLERWLSDRKGRTLSYDGVTHYGRIVVALKETMRLM